MNNQLIIDALNLLKENVLRKNLYWKEPHQACDEGNKDIYYEFFGCGGQGNESARLLMQFDENYEQIECCVISKTEPHIGIPTTDHISAYAEYLKLNDWHNLTVLI